MAKKKYSVTVIENLGDAVELMNHNSQVFDRAIKKLMKSNRRLKIISFVALGCALRAGMECRKQAEELYKLSVKVKKLENNEGE